MLLKILLITQYREYATCWATGVQFPKWALTEFLFTTASRHVLGPTQVSYPVCTGDSYPGGKAAGA